MQIPTPAAGPFVIRTRPVPDRAPLDDAEVYGEDNTPATHVGIAHTCTGKAHDQDSRRPRRRICYARTLHAQTDLWSAVAELRALNVDSEDIYIDRGKDALAATNRPQLAAALHAAQSGGITRDRGGLSPVGVVESWAAGQGCGGVVNEDPVAVGGRQRVLLRLGVLVMSRHPSVSHPGH